MNAMILMSSMVFIDLEECIQKLEKLTDIKNIPPAKSKKSKHSYGFLIIKILFCLARNLVRTGFLLNSFIVLLLTTFFAIRSSKFLNGYIFRNSFKFDAIYILISFIQLVV